MSTNTNIVIYDEIPEGGSEVGFDGVFLDKNIWSKLFTDPNILLNTYYACGDCEGYIRGKPLRRQINNVGSYYCCRCGNELGFYELNSRNRLGA